MNKRNKLEHLYKYCSWNKYTKENIINNQIYLRKASLENDPFESSPFLNKKEWAEAIVNKRGINKDRANRLVGKFVETYIELIQKMTFIGSFSETIKNSLMWSHYANGHKGVCIEYNFDDFISNEYYRFLLKKVVYSKKRVEWPSDMFGFDPLEASRDDAFMDRLYGTLHTKSIDWKYEKEWRLFDYSSDSSKVGLKIKSFKPTSIYIGCRADDKTIKSVLSLAKKLGSINVYLAKHSPKAFSLTFKKLM